MRYIHHLWITVHAKPEENEEQIYSNFLKLLPFKLENEKLKIERSTASIIEDRKIAILQIHLQKERHITKFIDHLNQKLSEEQKRLIVGQRESRLDSDNHFYIRIDKDILINEDRFFITDFGNCYHIKMSIAAFPTTRENALDTIKQIFLPDWE